MKKMSDDTPETQIIQAWHAIAPDLAQAAQACGESTIHVEDLADAISCYLGPRFAVPTGKDRFKAITRIIKQQISNGRSKVSF